MRASTHKDLLVWHKSMALVTAVYELTKKFPKEETYGLSSQIRRAAVSVPSNLAEGHAMKSTIHYLKFVYIARGSLAEVETQLMIANNLGYSSNSDLKNASALVDEVGKMLRKLIDGLDKKITLDAANRDFIDFIPNSLDP